MGGFIKIGNRFVFNLFSSAYYKNNHYNLKRLVWLVWVFFACVCPQPLFSSGPLINVQPFLTRVDVFLEGLIKLPEKETTRIFGSYASVIDRELDIEKLYYSESHALKILLNSAVTHSIDVLTLFTLPEIQQKNSKALVLDEKMLLQLNMHYNLHGLFLISTHSADDDSLVKMVFLVAGQGKLIIGYDKGAIIKHPDYGFATGRYEYQELFLMDARTDGNGNSGLFDIKGGSSPLEQFQWMKGPLNSAIKSLLIPSALKTEQKLLVRYEFFGSNEKIVPCIPIEKLYGEN